MNHYERLKVSPEAPPEVIRAAYRALATKLHPDRQGGDAGPTEEAHEAMAALNASYLVLTNAKARAAYDAQLKAGQGGAYSTGAFQTSEFQPSAFHTEGGGPNTSGAGPTSRMGDTTADPAWHDISWLKGGKDKSKAKAVKSAAAMGGAGAVPGAPVTPAKPLPQWAWALLFSSLATAAVMGWLLWKEGERFTFEKTLNRAMTASSAGGEPGLDAAGMPADTRRKSGQVVGAGDLPEGLDPEVVKQIRQAAGEAGLPVPADVAASAPPALREEDIAHLSNDELLARMPELIADGAAKTIAPVSKPATSATAGAAATPAAAAAVTSTMPAYSWQQGRHHLDSGQPLQLKLATSTRLTMPTAKP